MARRTNLALLALLVIAFSTGWLAFASATVVARWTLVAHGVAGAAIVALVPWKATASRPGLRRRRWGRLASLAIALLLTVSLAFGWLHSTGLWRWGFGLTAMEFHVGAAIIVLPLLAWHVWTRPVRLRRADLSRRRFLQAIALGTVGGTIFEATELGVRRLRLPGGARRFTGSYEVGSFEPAAMPVSSWMFDAVPSLDRAAWRLQTPGRAWAWDELASFADRVQATLDCTGGFYSEQEWTGAWLDRLLPPAAAGTSLVVTSITGYARRFPLEQAPRLLLATHISGAPLDAGHGSPARLVAADRRGYWWVKWVVEVRVEDAPAWWQPPFPLQ